ncbi:MAG: PD40 domain-containing protein, partial [Phycisphaerales bacterium]|nr:PD40 domain-containing protein [Phycisphaerales bacterium]
ESGMEGIYRASVTLTRSDVYPDADESAATPAEPDAGGGESGGVASGGDTPRRGPGGPGGGRRGPRPDDSSEIATAMIDAMLGVDTEWSFTRITDLQPAGDPVSGTWSGTVTGPEPLPPGGLPLSMTIRLSGTSVSGSMQAGAMPLVEFSGGTWNASARTLSWSMSVQEAAAAVEARLDDAGAMSGTVSVDDAVFRFNATRTGAAEPAGGDEPASEAPASEPAAPKTDHGARWADALRFNVEAFLVEPDAPHTRANISPDGRSMLVVRGNGDLIHVNLGDNSRRVLFEGWDTPNVEWAWDSRHIVFERSDLWFNSDIWIMDTAPNEDGSSREAVNVTRHPDIDTNPRLSHDGRVLTFQSDRAGDNFDFDIYCVYLDRDLEVMEGFEYDEHFKEVRDALNKRKVLDEIDFAADYTPPTPFEFDLDDAYLRVRRLTSFPGSESVVAISPAGDRILFNANIDGTYALYSVNHRGSDRKTVLAGGASGRANYLGDRVVYRRGAASTVSINGGSASSYAISATIDVVIADAQRQKALELGRTFGATFYHPTMKGLDWAGLTARYAELASYTRTTSSYNRVMNMLLGEINGSHIGVSGGGLDGYSSPNAASHGAIGADLTPVPGGYRVDRVLPGSPADARRSRLNPGDVIVAVEDVVLAASPDAMPSVDFNAAMLGRNNAETLMEIRRSTDGVVGDETSMILIVPTSTGAVSNMAYEQGVRDRRAEVDRLSNGRLGYLHIRGMSEAYVRDFERDLYAAAHGRDGLIIDVRDNGGGSTADYLLSSLTQPQHSFTVPRGADINTTPRDAYPRDRRYIYSYPHPINVLINQNSFSNAEIFAHAIKHIGRGALIGTPTFGGVISTGAFSLVDGTNVRQPFRGWYLPKPEGPMDLENNGAQPDVNVPQTPMDEAAGRDRQLEAAVRELLDRVGRGQR